MTRRSSRSLTRRWQGETDNPTLSASSAMVIRLSVCSAPRILRSMASISDIGMKSGNEPQFQNIIPKNAGMARKFENFAAANRTRIPPAHFQVPGGAAMPTDPHRLELLSALARKVLWLSSWTIHHANHLRPNSDGLKVGGHQASSASLVTIMSALYFAVLRPEDRVAVKPHASPVFHAIQYLLGNQELDKLKAFRAL